MTSEEIQSYSSHFLLLFDSCRAYRTIDLLSLVWSHKSIQFPFGILYTFSAHRINNHSWQIVRQMGNEVYSALGQRVLINICPWYIYIYILYMIYEYWRVCVYEEGEREGEECILPTCAYVDFARKCSSYLVSCFILFW